MIVKVSILHFREINYYIVSDFREMKVMTVIDKMITSPTEN